MDGRMHCGILSVSCISSYQTKVSKKAPDIEKNSDYVLGQYLYMDKIKRRKAIDHNKRQTLWPVGTVYC